jgi:type IV fimbrial biogenesis protein FimT
VLTNRHKQGGFTLVELMIGLAILALLLTQALPSFTSWLQNLQIRNTAESILNGLQLAKAQAVKSNTSVELVLTATSPPNAANVGAPAAATGKNWIVRTFQSTGAYTATDFIQGRAGTEGSKNATVAATQASFVFTPLGRLLNPPATNVNININNSQSYGNKRPMRVIVSPGGQILMCDPNKVDPSNPQFC